MPKILYVPENRTDIEKISKSLRDHFEEEGFEGCEVIIYPDLEAVIGLMHQQGCKDVAGVVFDSEQPGSPLDYQEWSSGVRSIIDKIEADFPPMTNRVAVNRLQSASGQKISDFEPK